MKGDPKFVGLGKSSPVNPVRAAMEDILCLLKQVTSRPTHFNQLCPTTIDYGCYCDACEIGIGGTIVPVDSPVEYTAFRFELPCDIQRRFHGDIELAALVMLHLMLELVARMSQHNISAAWSDSSPAVGWIARMVMKQSKIAGRLLRGLGLRQRLREMYYVLADHIPGTENNMSNFSSRSFTPALNLHDDSQLFAKFESLFPLPQGRSWQLVRPPKEITSLLCSIPRGRLHPLEACMIPLVSNTGVTGVITPKGSASIRTSKTRQPNTISMHYSLSVQGSGVATTVDERKSTASRLIKRGLPVTSPGNWQDSVIRRR
jgi:hypothetical protein